MANICLVHGHYLAQEEEGDPSALPSAAAPSDDWLRGGKARQHVEVMRGLVTEIRARDPTAADAYSKRVDRVHTALQLGNSSSSSSPAYVTNGGASTSRQEWRPYKPPPAVARRRAAAAASAAVTSPNANANVASIASLASMSRKFLNDLEIEIAFTNATSDTRRKGDSRS